MIRGLIASLAMLAALVGLSWSVVQADREQARANAVRLALWRLDASGTALVLAEAARPVAARTGAEALPEEPLWLRAQEHAGQLISSSEGIGEGARRLAELRRRLGIAMAQVEVVPRSAGPAARWRQQESAPSPGWSGQAQPAAVIAQAVDAAVAAQAQRDQRRETSKIKQSASNSGYESRQAEGLLSSAKGFEDSKAMLNDYSLRSSQLFNENLGNRLTEPMVAGPLTVRWLDGDLLLERPLVGGGRELTIIAWAQWERRLAGEIADLLPQARLRPVHARDDLRLASIPVALEPGTVATAIASATWWTLGWAWLAGLGGLAAVLWSMAAAARLAERRAAFVSAVTHELRTPLTALRLHGDLLADARIANDADRRAAPVAAIRHGATRLAHLIDNVLDYARLERRRPPTPRVVALDPLLAEVSCRLPGVELPPASALTVRCDPQAVERILANLADNAAKYGRPPLALTVRLVGKRVEVALTDHGPGLAADAKKRLFMPFARSAEAAAGDAPGVGLGLALCRRLALAQGGDLRLEDVDGGGVRAVLSLRAG